MGQKANPVSLRLILNKGWRSKWYANKQEFGQLLIEDQMLRDCLMKKPACVGTSLIKIRRMSEKVEITICTARPALCCSRPAMLRTKLRYLPSTRSSPD